MDYARKPCLPMEVLARVRIHLKLAARNMDASAAAAPEARCILTR